MSASVEISGWGLWPKRRCRVARLVDDERVLAEGPGIARGLGRSYGDSAMNVSQTLVTRSKNRFLAFDADTGDLVAEAGVPLSDVIDVFLKRGFFPPIVPGTKFVTLGGMVAADVHGKNHHKSGSFGDHVAWLDLLCADGVVRRCSQTENEDLFSATLGGMGLTGHILRVAFRLMRVDTGFVRHQTVVARGLDHAVDVFEENIDTTYSVAWIDCLARGGALGRSLVYLGEHAMRDDLSDKQRAAPFSPRQRVNLNVPAFAPSWALNTRSVQAFNAVYFAKGKRTTQPQIVGWEENFFPLDSLSNWNRIYGKRGFAQYQSVLPLKNSRVGLKQSLEAISSAGLGSFLAVLKRMGPGADRPLSFPMEGYTLALDFPLSAPALRLMDRLDEITLSHGGRLYLAKDSRMPMDVFERGYGDGVEAFRDLRARTGASHAFQSLQSQRLGL